jgi:transcriptional regulator with XRE-family HTH domain
MPDSVPDRPATVNASVLDPPLPRPWASPGASTLGRLHVADMARSASSDRATNVDRLHDADMAHSALSDHAMSAAWRDTNDPPVGIARRRLLSGVSCMVRGAIESNGRPLPPHSTGAIPVFQERHKGRNKMQHREERERMGEDMGSTVPRRQLGRALRDLRTEAGVTLDGAAEALDCSRQKVWRIESGLGSVRPLDVRGMCELYGATRELTGALAALAAETKAKGWWHSYLDAIPEWFELYVGLESAASAIRRFDEALIPGMLQSRAYAFAVYQHRRTMAEEERERLVEVRMQRQALLRRRLPPAPRLEVILAEAALLRTVGSAETMADQLRHLLAIDELPNVVIRVLPLKAGLHFGAVAGSFVMLDFPIRNRAEPEPSIIYKESLTGALYLDRKEELAVYDEVWANIDDLALDGAQSRRLINTIIAEVHHG